MNILVCIKQVPDTTEIKIDPVTNTLIRAGVPSIVNPFDAYALEIAARIKDVTPGTKITLLSMGPDQAKAALKECLAVGGDKAYLVSDRAFGGADTLATSYTLKTAIEKLEETEGRFDIIFCGKQAIDNDAGQVGPGIAEQLGISQITYVSEIVSVTEDTLTAKRVSPAGEEVVEAKLPVVLTCEKSLNEPRYPTLKRTRMANRAEIPEMDCAAVGADPAKVGKNSPSAIKKLYTPAPRQSGELIQGEAEEIAKIAVQKLVEQKII